MVGWKVKVTVKSLLLMILFFLFLTWYSAYYNKVTDCGCFGDALKLTPWQSFGKDVILTVLIIFLSYYPQYIKPIGKKTFPAVATFSTFLSSAFIAYYVLAHLPLIDFRAYAIGKNIPEGMEYKDDGKIPPVHDFMLEDAQNDLAPEILKRRKSDVGNCFKF